MFGEDDDVVYEDGKPVVPTSNPHADDVRYWIDKLNAQSTRTVKVQRVADDLADALFRLHNFGDPELVERALAAYEAARNDGEA